MAHHFLLPLCTIDRLQLIERLTREAQPIPMNIVVVGSPANRRFFAQRPPAYSIDDPLQHTHVLRKSRPQKLAVLVLAEPVHVEDARGSCQIALHLEPMPEVVAHVVSAEGKHGHRIAADIPDCACCCSRSF